jgi:hypothetical protein
MGKVMHVECLRCATCSKKLRPVEVCTGDDGVILCKAHFMQGHMHGGGRPVKPASESIAPLQPPFSQPDAQATQPTQQQLVGAEQSVVAESASTPSALDHTLLLTRARASSRTAARATRRTNGNAERTTREKDGEDLC